MIKRVSKRGQLTIFIIVAVIVVILIAFYNFNKMDFFNKPIEGSDVILKNVLDCMDSSTKESLYKVSFQGGYNNMPDKSFIFSPTFFPYYYYEGKSFMPSLEFIESEMGDYVDDNLAECLTNIDKTNFEMIYSSPQTDVKITKEGVEYTINMPITLKKDDVSMKIELSRYPVFYEKKLYDIYEVTRYFVDDQLSDPEYYCITCITEMCEEAGLRFYLFPVMDNVILIMVFEDTDNNPLVFNFINKYESLSEVNETVA